MKKISTLFLSFIFFCLGFFVNASTNLLRIDDQNVESLNSALKEKDQLIEILYAQMSDNEFLEYEHTQEGSVAEIQKTLSKIPKITKEFESAEDERLKINDDIEYLSGKIESHNTIFSTLAQLKPFTGIGLEVDDFPEYFERIANISQDNLYYSQYIVDPHSYGQIKFANSENTPDHNNTNFGTEKSKLYAHFDLPGYAYERVFIKWYKEGSLDPLELSYFDINPYQSENYVWLEPRFHWERGQYFVEIYDASKSANLLSAGSFFVE